RRSPGGIGADSHRTDRGWCPCSWFSFFHTPARWIVGRGSPIVELVADEKAMVGQPGHEDPGTGRPELRTRRALDVLLVHRESGPALGLDLVLRADPKIRRIDDCAIERVVAARGWYVGFVQADLLRPNADAQGVVSGV